MNSLLWTAVASVVWLPFVLAYSRYEAYEKARPFYVRAMFLLSAVVSPLSAGFVFGVIYAGGKDQYTWELGVAVTGVASGVFAAAYIFALGIFEDWIRPGNNDKGNVDRKD